MHLLGTVFLPVMAIFVIASGRGYFYAVQKGKKRCGSGQKFRLSEEQSQQSGKCFYAGIYFIRIWGGSLDSWYERHRSSLIVIGIVFAGVILYMIGFTFVDAQCNRQKRGHLALYFALAVPFALILTSVAFCLIIIRNMFIMAKRWCRFSQMSFLLRWRIWELKPQVTKTVIPTVKVLLSCKTFRGRLFEKCCGL